MTERTWHKGPPPHVGWWLTLDISDLPHRWRWWNGEHWSTVAEEFQRAEKAAVRAKERSYFCNNAIQWSDYWPENARVPRLDPTDGDWTFNTDGKQPDFDERVEVVFRNGRKNPWYCVENWLWNLTGEVDDIVAWRPAK